MRDPRDIIRWILLAMSDNGDGISCGDMVTQGSGTGYCDTEKLIDITTGVTNIATVSTYYEVC